MPEVRRRSYQALISEADISGQTLILAPVRIAADQLAQSSASAAESYGVYRQTLADLVVTLSSSPMNELGLVPLTRISAEAIAAHIVADRRDQLRYLGPVS